MDFFNLNFKSSIEKDLRRLPKQLIPKIWSMIHRLSMNPFPIHSKKLADSDRLFRLRVGDYRIVYEVDSKTKTITIHYVRHRREVYRNL